MMDKVQKHNLFNTNTPLLESYRNYKYRVFENRVLRRIFGPKREEVAEGWRKLHNKELHNLYASPNIIRVTKSRSLR
jgi:hypothetical protein